MRPGRKIPYGMNGAFGFKILLPGIAILCIVAFLVLEMRGRPASFEASLAQDGSVVINEGFPKGFLSGKREVSDPDSLLVFENKDADSFLRLQKFATGSEQEAKNLLRRKILYIQSLFADREAPYVGTISTSEKCLSVNRTNTKISEDSSQISVVFSLRATASFVYGSCSDEADIYKSLDQLLYCKRTGVVWEVKYFHPKTDPDRDTWIIRCKS